MKRTFSGGVHPLHNIHEGKPLSNNSEIARITPPEQVVIPLSQHAGAAAKPVVAAGDGVKMGQLIGECAGFVSANVHSSVSGIVKAVETRAVITGKALCVVIDNDGADTPDPSIAENPDYKSLSAERKLSIIKEAGIVGMGGAAFPLHVKLSPPKDKPIDYIILNGSECEPFLTIDSRTMIRHGWEVLAGLSICRSIVGAKEAVVAIEDNKPEAIACMKSVCGPEDVKVEVLKTKYPQGSEKQLIRACTGREVPSGGLPFDAGVIVVNVATCFSVYEAVCKGKPLYESALTVTGCVASPSNILVRVGTPFKCAIDACGGFAEEPRKVISGGPMMGVTVPSLDVPITKATSGVLALNAELSRHFDENNCIRCGRCVSACPMGLMPLYLNAYAVRGDYGKCVQYRILDCMECGSCSYSCPSRRYLLPSIRVAKAAVMAERRRKAAEEKAAKEGKA